MLKKYVSFETNYLKPILYFSLVRFYAIIPAFYQKPFKQSIDLNDPWGFPRGKSVNCEAYKS